MELFTALILLYLTQPSLGLVGYDCGGPALNISTFSLSDVGTCDETEADAEHSDFKIQLVQVTYQKENEVTQCRVEIMRDIYYCGMHSHTSIVQGGHQEYLMDLDYYQCKILHETNSIRINSRVTLDGLEPGNRNHRSVILAGDNNVDGTCQGVTYSDRFGSWKKVVVMP